MAMVWSDLCFMHWPVKAGALRPLIPPGLTLDEHSGSAWLGIVPFAMSGVRHWRLPAIPGTHTFLELNVRTYVSHGGKAGVWFFSLDAANRLAVLAARATFHLPYMNARMAFVRRNGWIDYASHRTHRSEPPAAFAASYRPTGSPVRAQPGSVESFLTDRYCLYAAAGRGHLYRGDIHHEPWPLQPAEAEVRTNTMSLAAGIALPDTPPLCHFAARLEVPAWWPERLA
ncbi:MAG: YqjF family protein [Phycisphaerales bacterium]